ncbi:hypothetical protein V8E36_005303 [Tilletia maclaganii]
MEAEKDYSPLKQFVWLAPSARLAVKEDGPFIARLSGLQELGVAVSELITPIKTEQSVIGSQASSPGSSTATM